MTLQQSTAAERGRKHRCAHCGAAFYDMQRDLTECPKCATRYDAAPQMPTEGPASGRRRKSARPAPVPVAKPQEEEDSNDDDKTEDDDVPLLEAADDEEIVADEDADADIDKEADKDA